MLQDKYKYFKNRCKELDRIEALIAIWAYDWAIANPQKAVPNFCEFHDSFKLKTTVVGRETYFGRFKLAAISSEVLQHAEPSSAPKRSLRKVEDAHRVFRAFNSFEDAQRQPDQNIEELLTSVHRTIQQQRYWQHTKTNNFDLPMYWELYSQPEIEEVLVKRIGLTFEQIYMIGIIFWMSFRQKPISLGIPINNGIPELDQGKIDNFLQAFCGDFQIIKKKLRELPQNLEVHQYRFNPLLFYPLIKYQEGDEDRFICPHPDFLFLRFTSGLFYDLISTKGFSKSYGAAFNTTVGKLLESSRSLDGNLKVVEEYAYRIGRNQKDTPDWIVHDSKHLIAIECKAKRPSFEYQIVENGVQSLRSDIGVVADAIIQLHSRILEIDEWKIGTNLKVLPVVCCLEDWLFFGTILSEVLDDQIEVKLKNTPRAAELKKQIDRLGFIFCKPHDLSFIIQLADTIGFQQVFRILLDKDKRGWMPETVLKDFAKANNFDFSNVMKSAFDERVNDLIHKFNPQPNP